MSFPGRCTSQEEEQAQTRLTTDYECGGLCENLGTFYHHSTSLYINLHISRHIYILNPSLGLTLSFEFILLAHMFVD